MGQEQAVSCSFSSMGHHGRLGNQIFQYALIKSISLAKGHEIFLPDSHDLGKYFVSEKLIGKAHSRRAPLTSRHYVETDPYLLDPEVFNISEDTDFHGYFQNMGYHLEYKKELFASLEPLGDKLVEAGKIIKKYCSNEHKSCSLHVRRGDYLRFAATFEHLDLEYYTSVLQKIPTDHTILVMSDDIQQVQREFKSYRGSHQLIFIQDTCSVIDFYIMYLCETNIISNSTFSWWASYLGDEFDQKVVYYPDSWIRLRDPPDLFKNSWHRCIKIKDWLKKKQWLELFSRI